MKYMTRKAIVTNTLVVVGILASFHVSSHVIPGPEIEQVPLPLQGELMLITVHLQHPPYLIQLRNLDSTLVSLQNSTVLVKLLPFFTPLPSTLLPGFEYAAPAMLSSILPQHGKNTIMSDRLVKEPRAPDLIYFTSQLPTNFIVKERMVCSS